MSHDRAHYHLNYLWFPMGTLTVVFMVFLLAFLLLSLDMSLNSCLLIGLEKKFLLFVKLSQLLPHNPFGGISSSINGLMGNDNSFSR